MSHWYDSQGNPKYTIKGANGKERDTTLRDARKLNLVPSVTTIMAGAAKPGLDNYLQTQLLNACLDTGMSLAGKSVEDWKRKVVNRSREHSSNAATKGTKIHDALEEYYLTGKIKGGDSPLVKGIQVIDYQDDLPIYETVYHTWKEALTPVIELLDSEFGIVPWRPEVSFSHRLGFGGKIDMACTALKDRGHGAEIILDFKTKDTDDIKKMVPYDEHGMQTAAYAVGLGIPNARRYNLFISTQVPGLLNLTKSTDFGRDWGMFKSLLDYWQLKNKYVPEDTL